MNTPLQAIIFSLKKSIWQDYLFFTKVFRIYLFLRRIKQPELITRELWLEKIVFLINKWDIEAEKNNKSP